MGSIESNVSCVSWTPCVSGIPKLCWLSGGSALSTTLTSYSSSLFVSSLISYYTNSFSALEASSTLDVIKSVLRLNAIFILSLFGIKLGAGILNVCFLNFSVALEFGSVKVVSFKAVSFNEDGGDS